MIRLLLTPFNSHKINGDLEPKVVGEVLQKNLRCFVYKYFAVTQKIITLAILQTKIVWQYCNGVMGVMGVMGHYIKVCKSKARAFPRL